MTIDLVNSITALLLGVLTVLTPLISMWIGNWLKKKTAVDFTIQIESAVASAIGYAEQLAKNHAKEIGAAMPCGKKLELALGFLIPIAEAQRWPTWAKDRLEHYVEAKLGQRLVTTAMDTAPATSDSQSRIK
jgi:hypothetical protein